MFPHKMRNCQSKEKEKNMLISNHTMEQKVKRCHPTLPSLQFSLAIMKCQNIKIKEKSKLTKAVHCRTHNFFMELRNFFSSYKYSVHVIFIVFSVSLQSHAMGAQIWEPFSIFVKTERKFLIYPICKMENKTFELLYTCLLYTSPSPRDLSTSRMPSSA